MNRIGEPVDCDAMKIGRIAATKIVALMLTRRNGGRDDSDEDIACAADDVMWMASIIHDVIHEISDAAVRGRIDELEATMGLTPAEADTLRSRARKYRVE
jgi:hypothetical protein